MNEERKQIKKLKKQLFEIQSLAKIGSWEWNKKINKIEWSEMMYTMLGYKPYSITPSYELAASHVN